MEWSLIEESPIKGQEALTSNDKKKMYKTLTKEPELSAPEIRSKAKIKASPRTISRELRKQGYKFMRILPVPFLNSKHIIQRINFADKHLTDRSWKKSLFLDESSFQAYTKRKSCYQKPDQRITNPRPKHPPTIHLIALISWRGPSRLILFHENMTASLFVRYLEILNRDALKIYPENDFRLFSPVL